MYKIFCDESNHLYNGTSDIMVIGGICCEYTQVEYINRYIKYLKHKHNANNELKWTKLNNNKKFFYKELLEFFYSRLDMEFNAQVLLEKSTLNYPKYNKGETDKFFYKMYYYTLEHFLKKKDKFNIFMDYKDTKGGLFIKNLDSLIKDTFYENINVSYTIIHSHESQIMQLCDVLIGAISYKNRKDIVHESEIKKYIIQEIERLSACSLDDSTPQWETKFRIHKFHLRKFNV